MIEQYQKFLERYRKPNGDRLLPKTIQLYVYYLLPYDDELSTMTGPAMVDRMNAILDERPAAVLYSAFRMWMRMLDTDEEVSKSLQKPQKHATSATSIRHLQSKIVSQQELRRLYKESDDFTKMIFSVLFDTGCRRDEILSVRLIDIDFKSEPQGNIYASIDVLGKGQKNRTVYLTKESVDLIKKVHKDPQPHDRLISFKKPNGKLIKHQDSALYKHVRDVTERVLGRKLSPHCFRASLATHLASVGADVLSISRLLGHSDIATTQIYTKTSPFIAKQAFQHIKDDIE